MSDDSALADGHHLARGAAVNALVLFAANFHGIFTLLIARLLGAAAFGRYGVVFMTADMVSKAAALGFDSSITPMVSARRATGDIAGCRTVVRRALTAAGFASAILAIGGLGVVTWALDAHLFPSIDGYLDNFDHGGAVMLLALPGIALARIAVGASRGLLAMRNEFYSRGLAGTWVTIGVFIVAIVFGSRDWAPALAVVAGESAAAVVALVLVHRALLGVEASAGSDGPLQKIYGSLGTAMTSVRTMLRYSLPTAGSSLLNVLVTEADVLLLSLYIGRAPGVTATTFGIFAIAAQAAVGLRKVRQVFDPIFAPVVAARTASEGNARLRDTIAAPGRWVFSVQLPIVGVLLVSGGAVMSIYGSEYREGAMWLGILAVAHGTNTFAGLVETLLMIERPGLNLANAALTVGTQIVSGVFLIPLFGVTGAALAMCLGFTLQGVLRFVELRYVYGWSWPWSSLTRPTVAFAIAFLPAVAMRLVVGPRAEIASGVLLLLLYAGAWRVLGADPMDREIWQTLRASRRRA